MNVRGRAVVSAGGRVIGRPKAPDAHDAGARSVIRSPVEGLPQRLGERELFWECVRVVSSECPQPRDRYLTFEVNASATAAFAADRHKLDAIK